MRSPSFADHEVALIESQRVAHLATADASGQPHVVPVCFVYQGGAFWIAIDEKPKRTARLKRLRNIEANPRVSLVFDRYDEDWTRLAYVLVQGTADVVQGGEEREGAIAALRAKYQQYRTMALSGSVIRIAPKTVVSWGALNLTTD